MKKTLVHQVLSALLLSALLLAAVPVTSAFAGDCDGTSSPDNITCSADPTVPDSDITLDDGDDILVVDAGVSTGEIDGGNGDDTITLNGDADAHSISVVSGGSGNDTITVNGSTNHLVEGDGTAGAGGDDTIIINGSVNGYVHGDRNTTTDGNDTIIVNGSVIGISGDTGTTGGNDTITVNGEVHDLILAEGGDDDVTIGENALVGNTINGGSGTDTLSFAALTQAQVNALGLNPAGDTTTINGHTYTWLNFEQLLGLLEELIERGLRVFFTSDSVVAVESNDGDGISFFAAHGRIAFVSFESLGHLGVGESASYSTPNSAGWYVTVINLGADPDHAGKTLFQVSIFAPGGASAGQFTFSN